MFWETNAIDMLGLISIIAGCIAIYYWIRIYMELSKGSLAWLLLTETSIFMIATPLFYYIFRSAYFTPEFVVMTLMLWGAVYVSYFAGAGYSLYRAFARVPRGSVGRYLIEGFRFKDTTSMGKIPEDNHPLNPVFVKYEGISQSKENKNTDTALENNLSSNENEGNYLNALPPPTKRFTDFLGNMALVQYTSSERYEDGVIEVALRFLAEGRNVVLVTSNPQIEVYKKAFKSQIDIGIIKLVDLVEDKGRTSQAEGIIVLQTDQSNYLPDILNEIPKRCILLFESPSMISSKNNFKYNIELLAKTIEKTVENEIGVVAFLDIEGVSEHEKNSIMDLFMTQALIIKNKITLLKGRKKGLEIPVLNYVDYEKYALR